MEMSLSNLPELIQEAYGYKKQNPEQLSPLTLAFIGDTVFDLIVRTRVILRGNAQVNKLHKSASSVVNATTQARLIHELLPMLTEEEMAIFRRGRNAKSHTTAKNASVSDYKTATGFEALLGWLYLKGDIDRITELVLPLLKNR